MKNKLKHAIIRFILYLVIILSLFAIVFSISFYTSYKIFFAPHNDVHLNGAKNLLKELPTLPEKSDEPSNNKIQNYTENPDDAQVNPEYIINP